MSFSYSYLQAREDWKYIAMVIDRIFLIVYVCVVVSGTAAIIFQAPLARTFFSDIVTGASLKEKYEDDVTVVNKTIIG